MVRNLSGTSGGEVRKGSAPVARLASLRVATRDLLR